MKPGFSGHQHTPEARAQNRAAHLGRPLSLEHRAKIGASNKGRTFSLETRAKISAANKGKKRNPEQCANLSAAKKNPSSCTRARISKARIGKHASEEARANMVIAQNRPEIRARKSAAHTGLTHSLVARAKISAAKKGHALSMQTRTRISKARKGMSFTPEHCKHMSEVRMGKKRYFTPAHCERISKATRGKKRAPHTLEHRQHQSASLKGRRNGTSNPNWRGGKSFLPYSTEWTLQLKERIRQRDHHLCQLCHIPENGKHHSVHHISYDKNSISPYDLITTCLSCNSKVNTNRPFWTRYFQLLMWTKYGIDYPILVGGL